MSKINYLLLFIFAFGLRWAEAHTLPQSKAQLIVNRQNVLIHFKTPVEMMELAKKSKVNLTNPSSLDSLKNYVLSHISISDSLKSNWKIEVKDIYIREVDDQEIGKFPELTIDIYLTPTNLESLKDFTMNCDLIIHQIPTQSIIFSVEQDWQNGILQHNPKQIGVIAVYIPTGKIPPLNIKLEQGTWFKGFKSMVLLGISHIAEGTDHILFILTLLLPAMLFARNKRWAEYMGFKSSIINLLKIITAFTIGHSLTLLLGTIKVINIPSKPIEVLIAITILISAIHALRPIYPKKETLIAGGFGLIHGLAFASTLTDLQLDTSTMIFSILGFNIGIELMQLFIILLVSPIIVFFSRKNYYNYIRNFGAIVSIFLAIFWIYERINA